MAEEAQNGKYPSWSRKAFRDLTTSADLMLPKG
jgi:hypothetical protein